MPTERRDHQVHIERIKCVGDPPRVEGRDQTVSLLSNNLGFDRVVPTFHERPPGLFEPLVQWGSFDDRTDDRAMLDARFHDAAIRFPQRGDRLTLSTNPWVGSLMHDCLDITQQRNNQVVHIREVLVEGRAAERRSRHYRTDGHIAEMVFPKELGRAVEDFTARLFRCMTVRTFWPDCPSRTRF